MDVCDSYTMQIRSSGDFFYKGLYNIKHIGEKSGELPEDQLKRIKELSDAVDWSILDKEYGSPGPGSQRIELIYTHGLESVTIVYYQLEPQEIRNIEQFIDQIIDNDDL